MTLTADERRPVELDDGLGGRDVAHERADDAGPERAEDRLDLALARGDADRDRDPAKGPGIEREHLLAELRRDEDAIEIEGRDEDLADGVRCIELPGDPLADRGGAPRLTADAEEGDVEPGPQVEDRADAGVRLERGLRRRVVEEPRRHEPVRLGPERLGDPPEGPAPVPAPSSRRPSGTIVAPTGVATVQGVRHGRHARPVADPDDRAVADGSPQDLGRKAADHPPREILRAVHRGREVDGVEAVAVTERVGGRGLRRGRIDDPDLDDALRPGTLQQSTHLRTRDAEPLGDACWVSPSCSTAGSPGRARRDPLRSPRRVPPEAHRCSGTDVHASWPW